MRFILLAVLLSSLLSVPSAMSPQAARDNNVEWDGIYHNSRDPFYRNPGWGTNLTGAVPLGENLTLRIRSYKNDLTGARVRMWDNVQRKEFYYAMSIGSSDGRFDYWEVTISSPDVPTDLYYAFQLIDGADIDWYNNNVLFSVFEDRRVYQTGGVGQVSNIHYNDGDYSVIYYDPSFTTPKWHKQGVSRWRIG